MRDPRFHIDIDRIDSGVVQNAFDGGTLLDPDTIVHAFGRNLVSRIRREGIGEIVPVLYSRIGYAVVEEGVGRVARHGRRDVVAVGLDQLHRGGNAILECGIARSRMAGRAACMEQDTEYPGNPYAVCPKFYVFLPIVHKRQKYVNPSTYSILCAFQGGFCVGKVLKNCLL